MRSTSLLNQQTNLSRQSAQSEGLVYSKSLEPPLVSWILCTHVGGPLLLKAIGSCLSQTYSNFELIVVINGNQINEVKEQIKTWGICKDHRLKIYETEVKNLTFSLSLGLHFACGKYIARMDGDDISYPNRISLQVNYLESNPDISVLGTAIEVIDLEDVPVSIVRHPIDDINIRRAMIVKNPLCHPSVMFRKDAILAVGGYLGGCHSEDYDLWVRLCLSSRIKFANLDDVCLGYRLVGVGNARRSRDAYASMAGTQLRTFLLSGKLIWIIAVLISIIKLNAKPLMGIIEYNLVKWFNIQRRARRKDN